MKPERVFICVLCLSSLFFLLAFNYTSAEMSPEDKKSERIVPEEAVIDQTADNSAINNQSENYAIRWYDAAAPEKSRGVALVIHGLNLRPDKMQSVVSQLTASGIDVCNLSLRGHGDNYDHRAGVDSAAGRMASFRDVSYPLWMNEVYLAYLQVQKRALQKKIPRFLLAYSLGGLLGLDLFASRPDVQFDRMVLFAPAIKLHGLFYIERALSPFPRLIIPSLVAPKAYLTNPTGTPIAAYNALFDGLAHFESHVSSKINVPTRVFIDPQDEFIPLWGLKNLIRDQHLDQWKLFIVKKGKEAFGRYHHHMIDAYSTGQDEWRKMMTATTQYLLNRR